jgi:hypothetical protein
MSGHSQPPCGNKFTRRIATVALGVFLAAATTGTALAAPSAGGGRPATPIAVSATPYLSRAMTITFRDLASNETAFQFWNGTNEVRTLQQRALGSGNRYYLWTGLAPNTYMCFKVRAYNPWGASDWSRGWVCGRTPAR